MSSMTTITLDVLLDSFVKAAYMNANACSIPIGKDCPFVHRKDWIIPTSNTAYDQILQTIYKSSIATT
jgi:hypothetical protein